MGVRVQTDYDCQKQSLRRLFENVYFITGTAYAGKSTMARMLAEKHGGICCGENYNEKLFGLADPEVSVNRFFERPDAEKQYLYQRMLESEDPEATLENYRSIPRRINSPENYRRFETSGFFVLKRDDSRTAWETLALLEAHFQL